MHNNIKFYSIQGQGHGPLEVEIPAIFKVDLVRHLLCQLANDYRFLNYRAISKFGRAGFSVCILVFVSRDFEHGPDHGEPVKLFCCQIWYVSTGRRLRHNDIKFDSIQGQGHGPLEVEISAIFKVYLLRHTFIM